MFVPIALLAIAHGLAVPVDLRLPSQPHAWFPIVLVSAGGEPLHPISEKEYPAIFYADRTSCMTATRINVRAMANAGVRGRFLCMYPHQSDAALARDPNEDF